MSSPPTTKAPPPSERCKALDKGKLVSIGSRGGGATGITAHNGKVYVFAWEGARATLVAFPRDGSKATAIGSAMLANAPTNLSVDDRGAAFVSGKSLMSFTLTEGSKPVELGKGMAPAVAISGEHAFGVRCGKPNVLVRLPRMRGEVETIAELPGAKCDFKSIAVDEKTAFVGDWTSRKIFAVDLASKKTETLVEKQAFLGSIAPTPDAVEFQASTGILSVPRSGGTAKSITNYGAMPFESVVWDEKDFYVLHTEAYAVRDTLVRIPRAGGKLEELEFWKVSDSTMGGGRAGVAVDDQCVYVAQNANGFLEVLARKKP